jgi:hypothetical protein
MNLDTLWGIELLAILGLLIAAFVRRGQLHQIGVLAMILAFTRGAITTNVQNLQLTGQADILNVTNSSLARVVVLAIVVTMLIVEIWRGPEIGTKMDRMKKEQPDGL